MATQRRHILVCGLVQGVCFRAWTRRTASRLNLSGWVRNLDDGRVEAVVEGQAADVQKMVEAFYQGPSGARVESVIVESEEAQGESGEFEIRDDW